MNARFSHLVLAILAITAAACDPGPRRLLTVATSQAVTEGSNTQVTLTVTNSYSVPIIPLSLGLYVRPDATQYLVQRRTLAEVEYYKPLQATEVRHLQTLDRIEVDHTRDGNQWRHVPDSRFLHPRILLPGQQFSQAFTIQALASYRKLLYADLYYLPLTPGREQSRLFMRTKPDSIPPDADRYTEVFTRLGASELNDTDPQPERYLLYRPARIHDQPPMLFTQAVALDVKQERFTYAQAARRARHGARAVAYLPAASTWAFEYPDAGTWLVTSDTLTKLKGHYAGLLADLAGRQATTLTLTGPRAPDDKLLQHFDASGFSDPKAGGPNAVVTIPADRLPTVLEQAEALGYRIEATTWKRVD